MWVDSHCHLDALPDPSGEIAAASAAGVGAIVTIGTDEPTSERAVELASRHALVWAAAGVHPHAADGFTAPVARRIHRLASGDRVVAVGEVGLDFYRDHSSRDAQRAAFAAQIQIAASLGKPLVMHIREAFDEVIGMLKEAGPPQGLVFHCFSGNPSQAQEALDLGGFISFAGNVSYKSAGPLREAARMVPMDRLLIETDSPFLAPVPHRGKANRPCYTVEVGEALAAALGREVGEIERATALNAAAVFKLPV